MPRAAISSDYPGYVRAVEALFDEAMEQASTPKEQKAVFNARADRLTGYGTYNNEIREALDRLPGDFVFTKQMAIFYLGYAVDTFELRMEQGPHPFKRGKKTTKTEIDAWHREVLKRKHVNELKKPNLIVRGRDLDSGRVYLIDKSGAIVSDGEITHAKADDLLAALNGGGTFRILKLADALSQPWTTKEARAPWADGYVKLLLDQVSGIETLIKKIEKTSIASGTGEATGKPVIRRP